ncbi:MAG: hypothetical protein NTU41_04290 [Chloroflexi bacterium]|nr:hypothetical protein [Chloroflexota bacterium]
MKSSGNKVRAVIGMVVTLGVLLASSAASFPAVAASSYTITAKACAGGAISPAGSVSVASGGSQTFTFVADSGYSVQDVAVDGTSEGAAPSYTFTNVQANHKIVVSFTPYVLQIVGATTCSMTQSDFESLAAQYPASFTDNNGDVWTGVPLWRLIALVDDGDPTTFNDSIAALYPVTATSSDAANNTTFSNGGTTPLGFPHNDNVLVANQYNGGPIPPMSTGSGGWVWAPLRLIGTTATPPNTSNHFSHFGGGLVELQLGNLPQTYAVTASVSSSARSAGCSVSGTGYYAYGALVSLQANMAAGWSFSSWSSPDITISNPASAPLSFSMPANSVAVTATFNESSSPVYTITASAGDHGSISPSGAVAVDSGGTQTFTINPEPGYHVADVLVDGSSVGALTSYTLTNVSADHTVAAAFASDESAVPPAESGSTWPLIAGVIGGITVVSLVIWLVARRFRRS